MTVAKKPTDVGKKVAKKQAAVRAAKIQGAAKRKVATQAAAAQMQVTSAEEWAASSQAHGFPLTVPSGKTALVRTVGMEAFLQKGLIPNSLRDIALQAIQGKKPQEMKTAEMSIEQIENMVELFDSVTLYCVIKPDVFPVPRWDEEDVEAGNCLAEHVGEVVPIAQREPALYVDMVDLEDKMFIFQFACGGTRDVESFRAEYARSLERVSRESDLEADSQ